MVAGIMGLIAVDVFMARPTVHDAFPAAPIIAPPTAPTAAPTGPPTTAPTTPPVTAPAAAEPPVVACFLPRSGDCRRLRYAVRWMCFRPWWGRVQLTCHDSIQLYEAGLSCGRSSIQPSSVRTRYQLPTKWRCPAWPSSSIRSTATVAMLRLSPNSRSSTVGGVAHAAVLFRLLVRRVGPDARRLLAVTLGSPFGLARQA